MYIIVLFKLLLKVKNLQWNSGEKWIAKYFQSFPVSAAQMVLWPCKPFQKDGHGDSKK